ncbi:MAG: HDOD domain-containing protein [Desulfovibrio sp.]|jgi:putative nucleotidyltransferase with HDIG domain|nr:HDOD domain-containing protein [Desulfovibrio sp.]
MPGASSERMQEARVFLEEISGNPPRLPYDPSLLPKLFAASGEGSNITLDELTALVERSPNLAASVLSTANAALYALESTVSSLHRAVSILGLKELRNQVIRDSASALVRNAKFPASFDAAGASQHQVLTAELAKALAKTLQGMGCALRIDPDEAYAAGLLHDIGKVLLAARRPQVWSAVEESREAGKLSFAEAEDEYWGIDHALVGAQVLHYWQLPLMLTDTINWHHAPQLAPSYAAEARLIAAADLLANEGLNPDGTLPQGAAELLPENADYAVLAEAARAAEAKARSVTGAGG